MMLDYINAPAGFILGIVPGESPRGIRASHPIGFPVIVRFWTYHWVFFLNPTFSIT